MRVRCYLLLCVLLSLAASMPAGMAREYTREQEERLGKQGCAEIEKEYKVLDDAAQLKRIGEILKTITPVTQRPDVTYRAKILKSDEVNALSLPGGFLYVTKGLLDAAGSDDELAGVLAHEVAHNAHRHSLKQVQRGAQIDQKVLLATIAAVLVGRDQVDPGNLMLLGQLLKQNALSGYGQKAEMEADRSAVDYLVKSKRYHPVGMLQFMELLGRQEGRRPQVELYVFQTHPPTRERLQAIRARLESHGVPIVRLPGKNTPAATARAATVGGAAIAEVVLKDKILFQPAAARGGKQPLQRAEEYARRVTGMFQEYPEERHVRSRAEGEEWIILFRNTPMLEITADDARFHKTTPEALAEQTLRVLKRVVWDDFVNHSY